jgi:predicted house-cleaning noncanonical NTP pyrophosphatase (MazG superfamily)
MEKLIRDKIHNIPHHEYPNMQTRKVADTREHIILLIAKIIEERNEFDVTIGIGKIEEAGDVLEAYDALIDLYRVS